MKFKCKLLPFAIAGAMHVLAGNAIAAPISTHSATATFSLGGVNQPVESQSGPISTPIDIIPSVTDSSGNNMFFHTYGSITPTYSFFGSRSSGIGVYSGESPYVLKQYFDVPAGAPQSYAFNFTVENGELSVFCSDCSSGGSAGYSINIWLDPDGDGAAGRTLLRNGEGSLVVNGDGSTALTHSGLALISAASGTTTAAGSNINVSYTWDATSFSVPLGSFTGGTQFLLEYELITRATGNFVPGTECISSYGGEFGGEYGGEILIGLISCSPGNTIARAGDPPSLVNVGNTGIQRSVPEPGSLALLGAGLAAGFAMNRRRKQDRKR
jgi:hypothetical protein